LSGVTSTIAVYKERRNQTMYWKRFLVSMLLPLFTLLALLVVVVPGSVAQAKTSIPAKSSGFFNNTSTLTWAGPTSVVMGAFLLLLEVISML